jgi:hypothetical protein
MHPGQPGHQPEDRIVRPGDAEEQLGDRHADGDQHTIEDAQGEHAEAGRYGDDQLATAEGEQPPQRWQVDQPDSRVDDKRGERSKREGGQQRARSVQDDKHSPGSDQRGELSAVARRRADRGAGGAAGDRETMHEADGGVPGAEGEQFPIGADLLAAPGERAGGEHVVAEGHDEHAERRQRQLAQPGRLQARESGGGQVGRDRPGYLDAVPLQPEPGAAYRAGLPPASGPIAVAVISAVVASGPNDRDRDDPTAA